MATERESELIEQLISKTDARQLPWETTARTDEFVTTFRGKYSVTVSRYQDHYGDYEYRMFLRDDQDREMTTLQSEASPPSRLSLSRLFEAARSSALKVDETLGDILNDLKSLP